MISLDKYQGYQRWFYQNGRHINLNFVILRITKNCYKNYYKNDLVAISFYEN